jgi:hypothetical protein
VTFYIQDPGNPETTYLIEVLLQECQRATGGGASFAWASGRGVNLLLENERFVQFLRQHAFDLIIGVDAVTDDGALRALSRVQTELPNLAVSVFLNQYAGSMFHPKVCWFSRGNKGALVAGSGNLTEGGLSRNWEAFTVTALDEAGLTDVQSQWEAWKESYRDDLFEPTNEAVIQRAMRNAAMATAAAATAAAAAATTAVSGTTPIVTAARKTLAKRLPGNKQIGTAPVRPAASAQASAPKLGTPPTAPAPLDVLIAEIPRASTRWNQANFDLENYEGYFGAKVGTTRHLFLRHVNPNGELGDTETRPSVAVKSSNWRFELAAAAGLRYPENGRPIAIFLKQASRNFLYRLLMPGDSGYSIAEKLLTKNWRGPVGRIRRVRLSPLALKQAWAESPLWKAFDPEVLEA